MHKIDFADSGFDDEAESMTDHIITGRKEDLDQLKKYEPKISLESAKDFLRNTQVSSLFPGILNFVRNNPFQLSEGRTHIETVHKETPLSEGFKVHSLFFSSK